MNQVMRDSSVTAMIAQLGRAAELRAHYARIEEDGMSCFSLFEVFDPLWLLDVAQSSQTDRLLAALRVVLAMLQDCGAHLGPHRDETAEKLVMVPGKADRRYWPRAPVVARRVEDSARLRGAEAHRNEDLLADAQEREGLLPRVDQRQPAANRRSARRTRHAAQLRKGRPWVQLGNRTRLPLQNVLGVLARDGAHSVKVWRIDRSRCRTFLEQWQRFLISKSRHGFDSDPLHLFLHRR